MKLVFACTKISDGTRRSIALYNATGIWLRTEIFRGYEYVNFDSLWLKTEVCLSWARDKHWTRKCICSYEILQSVGAWMSICLPATLFTMGLWMNRRTAIVQVKIWLSNNRFPVLIGLCAVFVVLALNVALWTNIIRKSFREIKDCGYSFTCASSSLSGVNENPTSTW